MDKITTPKTDQHEKEIKADEEYYHRSNTNDHKAFGKEIGITEDLKNTALSNR